MEYYIVPIANGRGILFSNRFRRSLCQHTVRKSICIKEGVNEEQLICNSILLVLLLARDSVHREEIVLPIFRAFTWANFDMFRPLYCVRVLN